ncbi:MAG: hypothetical protein Q4G09_08380, partial [Clostridia bacterium]|nr:hypothetical protein [Clostridia bacterium]
NISKVSNINKAKYLKILTDMFENIQDEQILLLLQKQMDFILSYYSIELNKHLGIRKILALKAKIQCVISSENKSSLSSEIQLLFSNKYYDCEQIHIISNISNLNTKIKEERFNLNMCKLLLLINYNFSLPNKLNYFFYPQIK